MNKILMLTLLFFTAAACKNEKQPNTKSIPKAADQKAQNAQNAMLQTGCYVYDNDGNTINMRITKVDDVVNANLDIAYAEKDANTGNFQGQLRGDTLIGTYTFNSEGIKSERDMAFLVKDGQLIEGYGEMSEDGTQFKDSKSISFSSTMPLSKVDCSR